MPGHAHLPGQDDVVADVRGAGQPHLRAEQAVPTYGRGVAHLHEIVDFGAAADAGFAHGGPVKAGVGLDFDVVFHYHRAGLDDLVVAAVVLASEAVAVAADYSAVLQHHAVAQLAVLAHHRVRVGGEVVADARAAVDGDEAVQAAAVADFHFVVNETVGTDGRVFSDLRLWRDDGGGVHPTIERRRLVEEFERAGKGVVGVGGAQGGHGQLLQIAGDDDGGRARLLQSSPVARIGKEGQLARPGGFNRRQPADFHLAVAGQVALHTLSNFA